MKKIQYQRLIRNKGELTDGYALTYQGEEFGVHKHPDKSIWTVTHVKSGLRAIDGSSRKDAIEQLDKQYHRVGKKKWKDIMKNAVPIQEQIDKENEHLRIWDKLEKQLRSNPKWHHITFPISGMLTAMTGRKCVDIFQMDKYLARVDSRYDPNSATWDGEPCSMEGAMVKIFGQEFSDDFKKIM